MKNWLCLCVRFLNGYHGSRNRFERDWPPSSARFFAALVDSFYRRTQREPELREALLWLERQPNPHIYCGKDVNRGRLFPTKYVPLNDDIMKNEMREHEKRERVFPVVYPDHDCVYYVWEGEDNPHWRNIVRLAKRLPFLGRSTSTVICGPCDGPPDIGLTHYVPDPNGDIWLWGHSEGRLNQLDECFANDTPPQPSPVPYSIAGRPRRPGPTSYFEEVLYFEAVGNYRPPIQKAAHVASQVRSQLLHYCHGNDPEAIVAKLHRPHLAYMPLSFVGGEYGDGLIYGVGIGIPKGLPQAEREQVNEILARLEGFNIGTEYWMLRPANNANGSSPHTLRAYTWEGPAQVWASVTPVEVNWNKDNVAFLKKLCRWQGLPEVESVEVSHLPLWTGSIPAKHFDSHAKLTGRPTQFQVHTRIRFRDPVRGPVSLGNLGLGVCKPVREAKP